MRARKLKHRDERLLACDNIITDDFSSDPPSLVPAELFPDYSKFRLEIGCGKGGFVRGEAISHPDTAYIAVELITAGMTVIFIGFICGYPSGSSTAAELCKSGRMTAEEASSLLPFTNCAGAAFLIGAVGSSMLDDTKAGVVLFITQSVTSALLLTLSAPRRRACLARAFPPPPSENSKPARVSGVAGAVASAVAEGGAALIPITSFVTFFRALTAMTAKIIKIPAVTNLFACIFEVTCGLAGLAAYYTSKPMMTIALSAAAVGFSGLSVMAQVFERASDAKIKTGGYFAGKLVLSLAMAIISVPIYRIFYENNTKIAVILCVFLFAATIARILCEKLSKKGRKLRKYDI